MTRNFSSYFVILNAERNAKQPNSLQGTAATNALLAKKHKPSHIFIGLQDNTNLHPTKTYISLVKGHDNEKALKSEKSIEVYVSC